MIDINGYTYCHEHLYIDLSSQKDDPDCRLDQYSQIKDELIDLRHRGVFNIIEMTNLFMGRNPQFIEDLIKETEMNILLSTGYYIEGFFPETLYHASAQDICNEMVREIEYGIKNSNLKASVIGEIGSSENFFSPTEKKVFQAAAMAHYKTGRPISTHLSMSTMGKEQVSLLKSFSVNLERVTIGHCDLRDNLDDILWLIDQGCYIQFDTIGKNNYYSDKKRTSLLIELSERFLLDRVMLSMDITRRSHLKSNGGLGFCYLMDEFVPNLKAHGINEKQLDQMLRLTPYQLFN
ncbi:hypothetical protein [Aeromonas veronii]|uniref:phosphotriesterase family protein n=1 Tax=Aeromonas veronii TaxID=654 RepID=UPI003D1E49AB